MLRERITVDRVNDAGEVSAEGQGLRIGWWLEDAQGNGTLAREIIIWPETAEQFRMGLYRAGVM